MKEVIKDVLSFNDTPFKVPMKFYESVEEGDKHAGKQGAVLEECNLNLAYRGTYASARKLICEIVSELTGVKFNTVTNEVEKDGKKVKVTVRDPKDTDSVFVKRALATKPGVFAQVQEILTKRARGWKTKDAEGKEIEIPALAVDITEKERTPRVLKLAQKYKDIALSFLKGEKNLKKFNEAQAKFSLPAWTQVEKEPTHEANVESLGWALKAFQDAQDAFKGM